MVAYIIKVPDSIPAEKAKRVIGVVEQILGQGDAKFFFARLPADFPDEHMPAAMNGIQLFLQQLNAAIKAQAGGGPPLRAEGSVLVDPTSPAVDPDFLDDSLIPDEALIPTVKESH
jgi:hypothetical protein